MLSFTELQNYDMTVHDFARDKVNFMFHNSGNEHALIICKHLFNNANNTIRIAANQLYNDEVVNTPEYIETMRTFLEKRKGTLKIIVSNPPQPGIVNEKGSFYGMLYDSKAYKNGQIDIRNAEGKSFRKPGTDDPVNFCTGDDGMYRFEWDTAHRKADANFKDPDRTGDLNRQFDKIFKTLPKLDLNGFFARP